VRASAKNETSIMLKKKIIIFVLVCLVAGPLMAQESKVTSLISKDLREFSGKEGLMITVDYAPGGSDPVHRHNAHTFVYVLEGSVVMQVKGEKEVTLHQGRPFMKAPMISMSSAGTQATPSQPNSWFSFLRTRALRC